MRAKLEAFLWILVGVASVVEWLTTEGRARDAVQFVLIAGLFLRVIVLETKEPRR